MMPTSHPRLSLLSLLLATAALVGAACSGGGGGGSTPVVIPNGAPIVPLPAGITGTAPAVAWTVPASGGAQITFVAADPDGDALQWEVGVSGTAAQVLGLRPVTPGTGPSLLLELDPVASPAVATVNLIVRDRIGASLALALTVRRSGLPDLVAVQPTSAFGGQPLDVRVTGSALALGGSIATEVSFGGALATAVVAESPNSLRCRTPSVFQTGPVSVGVTTPFGSDQLPPDGFAMMPFPPSFAATDRRIDSHAGNVSSLELRLDDRRAHAVYIASSTISYARSDDAGQTFAAPLVLSAAEVATEPHTLAAGDVVHVAWIGDGQQVWLRLSLDGGSSFQPAVRLDSGSLPVAGLRLASGGGLVYAAWIAGDPALGQARATVAFSADGGATFAASRAISPNGSNQREVAIVADGAAVVAAYLDDRASPAARGLYVARSTDAGATWSADRRLSAPGRAASQTQLLLDGVSVHVVWRTVDGISYNGSTDRGANWRTPEVAVRGLEDGTPAEPQVHASGDRVYVAYTTNGSALWVARSGDAGTSFPARTRLDAGGQPIAAPRLAGDGDYVAVTWHQGDAALDAVRGTVTLSTDRGETWRLPAGFGNGSLNQGEVQVRQAGGRLLLGFVERRNLTIGAFVNANLP